MQFYYMKTQLLEITIHWKKKIETALFTLKAFT